MLTQSQTFDGKSGTTFSVASTDTAQALSTASIDRASGLIITTETASIRYAFGATPTQAGLGHLAVAGTTIVIASGQMAKAFRFISSGAGVHGTLQVTPLKGIIP